MDSPLTFLTFRYLEGNLGPGKSRDEADLAGQELEIHLEEASKEESELFEDYVALTKEEFDTLAPHTHEWFLERIILQPTLVPRERLVPALVRAFFLDSSPTLPYLAVSGLIEAPPPREDRVRYEENPGVVLPIIRASAGMDLEARRRRASRAALGDQEIWGSDQDARLVQLAEILLDMYSLIPESIESTRIQKALSELNYALISPAFAGQFREALKERADQLTGEKRAVLEALLRQGGERSR